MPKPEETIRLLLEEADWENCHLLAHLLRGMNYPKAYLKLFFERLTRLYFQEFMPDMGYHRFGCTLMDRMTFELIFKKMNEFFTVHYTQVEYANDTLTLLHGIFCEENNQTLQIDTSFDDFNGLLYPTLQVQFIIGQIPQS
ncbi:MAG TPA: hypothetical protein DCM08_14435 [Microscillaceae bacterium]|jgi:hypothetical protein|nr:hypothetical protein [Microscillaceae bacterium]